MTVPLGAGEGSHRGAAWLLEGLGATVTSGRPPAAALLPSNDALGGPPGRRLTDRGLPRATVDYACSLALAGAGLAALRSGTAITVSELAVAVQVWLPEIMAAAYDSPTGLRPKPPRAAPGGGAYHADLGSPGADEDFQRMLATLPPAADAATIAETAQLWRLPVCDYRPFRRQEPVHPISWTPGPAADLRVGGGGRLLRICDLTSMWAGPLATWLLQQLGAEIVKVEPSFRPDGFRAVGGGGIFPGGTQVDPGRDSALWNALNRDKATVDLDLRDRDQLEEFVGLASTVDVVIDSFSPRVLPNLGVLDRLRALPRPPLLVSMPAFPAGPQRSWVAFGNGVHAVSGLGDAGEGGFRQPPVSYPDPLAGLAGALAVLAGVVGREAGNPVSSLEVSLASASQPLASSAPAAEPAAPGAGLGDPEIGGLLLRAAADRDLLVPVEVAGQALLHPTGPYLPF